MLQLLQGLQGLSLPSGRIIATCLGIALGITALLFLLHNLYNIHLHPLSSYPGPLLHRGSSLPYLVHEFLGTTVHAWSALHAEYGPVVRISPNQLSYIDPAAWRDIYGARGLPSPSSPSPSSPSPSGATHAVASSIPLQMPKEELVFPGEDFEFFAPAKPMISCDPLNHARHRRAVGSAFSERAVRSFEPVVVRFADRLLERMEEEQDRPERKKMGEGINIMDWFHFAMFDMTSALVFGRPFGNLEKGAYHPWVGRVFPGMKLIAWSLVVTAVPGLGRVVSWVLPRKLVEEARRHMQSIIDMADARCRAPAPQQADFMSYILPNVASEGDHKSSLSTDELYLNAQLLCIAGSETTASLLAGAVFFLSRPENARHKDRLMTELQAQFASEADMTPTSLAQKAPFLAAVLNECLRLYPPGAINMPRTVPAGGATIAGRYVPGGSVVGIAQFAAYRSARHWIDPLTFAPERWLPSEAGYGRYAGDRRDVFKPFSYGPRNCVGQSLAIAECRLIVAKLFRRFAVDVLPGQEAWMHQKTFLSWEKPPLMVRLRRHEA